MMTAPDEVTLNKEPVLIITFVCLRICFALSQPPPVPRKHPPLIFSQYSHDMSRCGREARRLPARPQVLRSRAQSDGFLTVSNMAQICLLIVTMTCLKFVGLLIRLCLNVGTTCFVYFIFFFFAEHTNSLKLATEFD